MRKTQLSQLDKIITCDVQPAECNARTKYVIDGGALLHKVKWAKKTYHNVIMQYMEYIHCKYGHQCCIVFDGYEGPSTKSHDHIRRVRKTCANIQLSEAMEALYSINKPSFPMKETKSNLSPY